MPKFLVRWGMSPKECFKTAEERRKFEVEVFKETMAQLQAGFMKDWGGYADGSGGYFIYESPSEADVFASLRRWMPQINFEVREVLTIEQFLELRKAESLTGKQTS
jgi:hypothetical protein